MRGLLRAVWRAFLWLLGGVASLWALIALLDKPGTERLLIVGFLVLGYLVVRLGDRLLAIERRLAWIDATLYDIRRDGAQSGDMERLDAQVRDLAAIVREGSRRSETDWGTITR